MHELSIAESLLDAVRAEARKHPSGRVTRVGLRVGELAAVDPESLRFSFELLSRESELHPLELEIEFLRRRYRCPQCGEEFSPNDWQITCRRCGVNGVFAGGDELEIAYLELEER
jgi:hydrogenase nickel incorporation protein HypA/HybF